LEIRNFSLVTKRPKSYNLNTFLKVANLPHKLYFKAMEALLLPPSPEPQNQITNPANSKPNHQSGDVHKDETMMMKKKKDTNPSNLEKRKLKGKKKEIMDNDEASSSYCSTSSTSNSNSTKRVTRVVHRLRNPMRLGMARRSVGERQAEKLAKPLGFSLAAFANMVRSISKL